MKERRVLVVCDGRRDPDALLAILRSVCREEGVAFPDHDRKEDTRFWHDLRSLPKQPSPPSEHGDTTKARKALKAGASTASSHDIRVACGEATRIFEAWMLADEGAFRSVFKGRFQKARKQRVLAALPRSPESLPLDSESVGPGHPKYLIAKIMTACGETSDRGSLERIARSTDIEVLTRKCPKSFKPFRISVEDAFRSKGNRRG